MLKSHGKNIIKVLSANIVVTFISIVQSLILPNYLNPTEYGYWSLYLLYIGYACFLMFGMCDGFYLRFSGTEYKNIDKKHYSSLHILLLIYLFVVLAAFLLFINCLDLDKSTHATMICIGISSVLSCDISFFALMNQMTSRFNIYAWTHMIWKSVLLIGTVIIGLYSIGNSLFIISVSIIGQAVTLGFLYYYSRDILWVKPKLDKAIFVEAFTNIKTGIWLTTACICAGLVTGVGKFTVQHYLGIGQLGYYSFVFTLTGLFTPMIQAVAIVLFPSIKQTDNARQSLSFLNDLDHFLSSVSCIFIMLYYPMRLILSKMYPSYLAAMDCMIMVLPIIILQSRIVLVYNTIYKVHRYEKQMVFNAVIAVLLCIVFSILAGWLYHSIESIAFVAYFSHVIWLFLSNRKCKVEFKLKTHYMDILYSGCFILINTIGGFNVKTFTATACIALILSVMKWEPMKRIVLRYV